MKFDRPFYILNQRRFEAEEKLEKFDSMARIAREEAKKLKKGSEERKDLIKKAEELKKSEDYIKMKKENRKKIFIALLYFLLSDIIFIITALVWMVVEYNKYGYLLPSRLDSLIAIVFSLTVAAIIFKANKISSKIICSD